MEDFVKALSESARKKLQGKIYLIESIRPNKSKSNGFFIDTVDFTVYAFKSSEFIKQIEDADHPEQLRNFAPCLEIDFEAPRHHHLGFDDEQECQWFEKDGGYTLHYPKSSSEQKAKR